MQIYFINCIILCLKEVFEISSMRNHGASPASNKPISNPIMLSIMRRFCDFWLQNYYFKLTPEVSRIKKAYRSFCSLKSL